MSKDDNGIDVPLLYQKQIDNLRSEIEYYESVGEDAISNEARKKLRQIGDIIAVAENQETQRTN